MLTSACFLFPATVVAFTSEVNTLSYPSVSSASLRVYTPEQEADFQEKESASDEVLKSLVDKLDKSADSKPTAPKKDNKAMAFLRKVGKVGGNKDFTNAVGSDEGAGMAAPPSAQSPLRKALDAYQECTVSGVIDDVTQIFPLTSSGTEWRGVSDRVRGGFSNGFIKREVVEDKPANTLVGNVVLGDNGSGFLQMVTDLSLDPSKGFVDASEYDGIELDVLSKAGLNFNVHLRTPGSVQQASYRYTVNLEVNFAWQTVRIPFSSFQGTDEDGNNASVDYSKLKRIGIVALDEDMDVNLAIGGVRFYSVF